MLKVTSILDCNEYFHTTKISSVRHLQTVCNTKPKPSLQILGPGSKFGS